MKKIIYVLLIMVAAMKSSATTYYWIGGTTGTSFVGNTYWTTDPIGRAPVNTSGIITIAPSDVFIFDGSNIGGTTVVTGAVSITMGTLSASPFAQLKLINGANISLGRAGSGSSAIDLKGDGTNAPDLVIDATSTLTQGTAVYDYNVQIIVDTLATALISGKVYLSPLSTSVHTRSYITSKGTGNVVFATGSSCYVTDSSGTSGFYNSVAGGVIFNSGASLYYYTGKSPIGTSSTVQISMFEPGSNYYIRGSNLSYVDGVTPYTGSNWTSSKTFANVYIQNGATYNADGTVLKIENLTIDAGCTYTTHTSGQTPVLGNLEVNGTLTGPVAASTNVLVIGGNTPQTISGTGTITVPSLTVCDKSDVTLGINITTATTTNIVGKLNLGTYSISGTSTFISRVAGSTTAATGNTVAGSYQITGASALTGNTGLTISGAGIQPNTNVVGFSTGIINLSKPATATATGAAFTFASAAAVLTTANPNGFDSTTGSVKVTGIKTFQTGTNYVVNAATTYPIGISSSAPTSMGVGSLTLNAAATTNISTKVAGTLTINSGKLTIRPVDTLRIISGNDIAGSPFSATKYIVTANSGSNIGVLRIDSFSTSKTFPIGTATNYLPVTLTPTGFMGYEVNVFQGATTNAMPTGTAFTSGQKVEIVDAVWNISKTIGTGNTNVNLNWTANLEGATLSSVANNQIGISAYNGTAWTPAIATSADNNTNTVTASFATLTSFGVGKLGLALPADIRNLSAIVKENIATINWQSLNETALDYYVIERSGNGETFNELGKLKALNNGQSVNSYSFADTKIASGNNYYRIKMVNTNGSVKYSTVLLVKNVTRTQMAIYPNPVKAGSTCTVSFNANEASNITFRTINIAGQVIATKHASISKGLNVITVETNNNIPSGNYILSVIDENTQTTMSNLPLIIK